MEKLSLPQYQTRLKEENGTTMVFGIIRKKYLVLTPEEWVRQHFVSYLIEHLSYPKALITVEQGLRYNSRQKRSDIIVFDRKGKPLVLVECKATSFALNQKVMEQAMMYNKTIRAPYIMITNGIESSCMYLNEAESKVQFLPEIPSFNDICK